MKKINIYCIFCEKLKFNYMSCKLIQHISSSFEKNLINSWIFRKVIELWAFSKLKRARDTFNVDALRDWNEARLFKSRMISTCLLQTGRWITKLNLRIHPFKLFKSYFSLVTGFKTLKQIIQVPLAPRIGLVDVSFEVFANAIRTTPLPTTIQGNLNK